jgi:NADH-quinone oxidoreductase subunit L
MPDLGEDWEGGLKFPDYARTERHLAHYYSLTIGLVVLGAAALGLLFALLIYYANVLDSAETEEQFPGVIDFLRHKWYFDEFYSVALVRPALVVGQWFKWFDKTIIDGFIHFLAWFTVSVSWFDGLIDRYVVDGLVNLTARVFYRTGAALKSVQTGYLRNYVLFLVLAAVGIYIVLSYFAGLASAG